MVIFCEDNKVLFKQATVTDCDEPWSYDYEDDDDNDDDKNDWWLIEIIMRWWCGCCILASISSFASIRVEIESVKTTYI